MVLANSPFDARMSVQQVALVCVGVVCTAEIPYHPPTLGEASVLPYYAASRGLDKSQPWGKFRLHI